MASVELPSPLVDRITDLVAASGRSPDNVVGAAVVLLEQHWVRDADAVDRPDWPFHKLLSASPADAVLRQRDQTNFTLDEQIVYTGRPGPDRPPSTWHVGRNHEVTDLASIPAFLTWLIPRYGRHTLAAIVHDHLQDCITGPDGTRINNGDPEVSSADADYILREAGRASGVPFVRRWVMWAGVSVRTLAWHPTKNPWYVVLAGLWVIAYGLVVGVAGVGYALALPLMHAVGGHPAHWTSVVAAGLVALASPLVTAALWGIGRRRYPAGLIAAYVLMVVALPVVMIVAVLVLYAGAEWIAKVVRPQPKVMVDGVAVTRPHNPILARNWSRPLPATDSSASEPPADDPSAP